MRENEIKKIIKKLEERAFRANRKCLIPGCNKVAIQSHLLQKNGIINLISENQKVYYINHETFRKGFWGFKEKGVNDVFKFPGFCETHDDELFSYIEKGEIDFNDYRTELLFSYRALVNEKRKKEIVIDFYNRILNSNELKFNLPIEYLHKLKYNKEQQELGMKDESYYEQFFINNINDKTLQDFSFISIELPRIEVCSSAVFTYESTREIQEMYNQVGSHNIDPLTEIYINLLPRETSSILILGCLSDRKSKCWEFIESFISKSYSITLKKISDLLLNQVENWLCSPSFYNTYLLKNENRIVEITHQSIDNIDERKELRFNLFEELKFNGW
ncbi:MAG: hypothetical protein KAT48_07965 [Bacteroidales bacterium]|nr:hypothetical protein [Bacteroidales bacterium]